MTLSGRRWRQSVCRYDLLSVHTLFLLPLHTQSSNPDIRLGEYVCLPVCVQADGSYPLP